MKAKVTLLVDKDTVEKAKNIGINLSQFLEHNLKRAISALEEPNSNSTLSNSLESTLSSRKKEPREGFEPSTSCLQGN